MTLSSIEIALQQAQRNGFLKPKIRINGLIFYPAPATGKNPGAVYVVTADRKYIGRIFQDNLYAIGITTNQKETALALMRDCKQAVILYGHQSGVCGICNRRLDNARSVQLGIGPICAEKMGWIFPRSMDISEL